MMALMISLPEDWEYTVSGLAVKAGCGREKVRRLLKELQTVGYLIREQSHDAGGKFGGNVYVLQDEAPPLPENPSNGETEKAPLPKNTVNGENRQREKPSAGFPPQQNKDLTENIDLTDPPYSPPKGDGARAKRSRQSRPMTAPDWKPERFAKFWAYYPRGENKQRAIRAWDKLRPSDELIDTMARALARQMASEEWQRGIGIPHASSWINGRRWEDEDRAKPARPSAPAEPGRVVEEEGTYLL